MIAHGLQNKTTFLEHNFLAASYSSLKTVRFYTLPHKTNVYRLIGLEKVIAMSINIGGVDEEGTLEAEFHIHGITLKGSWLGYKQEPTKRS